MSNVFEDMIPKPIGAPGRAAVHQRVCVRIRNLRGLHEFGQEHQNPQSVLPTSSDEVRKLSRQHFTSSSRSSRIDSMTDDEVVREALKARRWLFGMLDCQELLLDRERELRMFRLAAEKEISGGRGESQVTDMERLYMALTDYELPSPEERLKSAFALVLHLNFAEQLKDVIEQISLRTKRIRRKAAMDDELPEIFQRILEMAYSFKVDQFACAVPLSLLAPSNTASVVDDNAGCCPICQSSYTELSDFPIAELLADFPVRIKYCGHVVGKRCLEMWMETPKVDEARYPHRTCPLCRVKLEGVPDIEKPLEWLEWSMGEPRALATLRELFNLGLEVDEACGVMFWSMSEEIACEELMAEVERTRLKGRDATAFDKEEIFLKHRMGELDKMKWAWGFRGDEIWKKVREAWMNSGVPRKA